MSSTPRIIVVIALLLLPGWRYGHAQEFADPLVQKLNDFLPTYTPFIPPEPPDRYFPDEVGKKVADAIINTYLQNPERVEQRARELAQHDAALIARGEQPTGVTQYVQILLSRPLKDDEKDDQDLADLNGSPDQLLTEADQLVYEAKRGRVGRRFNWVLSTLDVGGLLFGAPRGPNPAAAQGVVSEWSYRNG